jgi:hypothetical protein
MLLPAKLQAIYGGWKDFRIWWLIFVTVVLSIYGFFLWFRSSIGESIGMMEAMSLASTGIITPTGRACRQPDFRGGRMRWTRRRPTWRARCGTAGGGSGRVRGGGRGTGGRDWIWSIDANSVAPAAAQDGMYEVLPPLCYARHQRDRYECSVRGDANVYGSLSVAVPGFVGGVGTLWERWGKLKWADVVAPAMELAAGGLITNWFATVEEAGRDRGFPSTAAILKGDRLPEVARTLDLGRRGVARFLRWRVDRDRGFRRGQGRILTRADMADSARVTALPGSYRGCEVHRGCTERGLQRARALRKWRMGAMR